MKPEIRHHPELNRFDTEVDGHTCVLEYRLQDGIASMDRVYVPEPVGGRGIAGAITRAALDHARQTGWQVTPNCPYVRTWIERHSDYRDLIAE